MVTDQNHSSNSAPNEQEVFRYEKIANRIADIHSVLSKKMEALDEKIDNYYSEYRKSVKRLERDVRTVENELAVRDDCVDKDTVVDLIQEIVPLLVRKKSLIKNNPSSSSSESSEESDLDVKKIIHRRRKKRLAVQNSDHKFPNATDKC
jgi:hypothetical protein